MGLCDGGRHHLLHQILKCIIVHTEQKQTFKIGLFSIQYEAAFSI